MANEQVTVLARMRAKDGMEEKVKQELLSLVPQTKTEEGCINYDLHQSPEDNSLFMFYENWRSKADLDKHFETQYLQAFLGKAEELLAEPPDITFWQMVS
jgi:quinol monooxygenase YgiN